MTFVSPFRAPISSPFPSQAVTGPVVLFYDTFTGTNGTLVTAHTPNIDLVGGGWLGSNFALLSNQAAANLGGTGAIARIYAEIAATSYTLSVLWVTRSNRDIRGPSFRVADASNAFYAGYPTGAETFAIVNITGGSSVVVASTSYTFSSGTVTVVNTPTDITATFGTASLNYSSTNKGTNTKVGFWGRNGDAVDVIDNFQAVSL